MERILKAVPATISNAWYQDGVIADPGAVTVTVTRDDGTAVTSGSAAGTGAAARTYNLTTTHTALLDILTVSWVSGTLGTLTTTVEVVGDYLFTIQDARAINPLSDTTAYPTQRIVDVRTLVEEALEDACGVAFVPRYRSETLSGDGSNTLLLSRPRATTVRSVLVSGTAIADLTTVTPGPAGELYSTTAWTTGFRNVLVRYEHGFPYPPARVARAGIMLTKRWLVDSPVDDRFTSMSTDEGTFSLVTPGMRGALFDIPEVNAVVDEYGQRRIFA